MPWYVVVYIAVLAAIALYSFYDDVKAVPAWHVVGDAVVSLLWILAVVAYYDSRLSPTAAIGVPLLVVALAWTAWDVRRELRGVRQRTAEGYDPQLSPRLNAWVDRGLEVVGVIAGTALLAPAIVLAIRVLQRG